MINIPQSFLDILKENLSCETSVKQTILKVQPILEDNKLVFFSEYTNHGEKHINSVLMIASKIIEEKTYDLLSPFDIEVLIDSILLHDLGMHISYAGFIYLIETDEYFVKNIYNDRPWSKLWQQYIKEARKWNSEKKKDIFGQNVKIEDVPKEELEATKMHKLLIGEFLRRYHPKLAYDIAVKGFPSNNNIIDCLEISDDSIRKIVAHVSRSHGIDLWKMVDYMKEEYDSPRMISEVKLIYNMSVLRIADYFDIDKSRANKIIWNIKKIDSRISKLEWEQHNCVDGIEFDYQEDTESLYIRVNKPNSSNIFLKINNFIKDLQSELDITWAVMGKIYTRYADLKIKFRRVYSNLSFLKENVPYVTKEIKFDVNRNILFSLAQPLYGSNPSYGIRELLQNASDACKERKSISDEAYIPQVSIEIKNDVDKKYIIIKDNGIGMNEDVIINYFLVAGSSFTEDIEWKNRFILDNQKIVVRNGKFGIGVIAAFLLGEKINVETTHIDKDIVYSFNASLEMNQIELFYRKRTNEEFGTKITIETNKSIISIIKYQWDRSWNGYYYYHNSRFNDKVVPWYEWYKSDDINYKVIVPTEWNKRIIEVIADKNIKWHTFCTDDYEKITWTYDSMSNNYKLICNGIIIPEAYTIREYDFPKDIKIPLMSITDREGKLPLNLSRSGLEEHTLPFEKMFMKEIYKDLLDYLETCEEFSYFSADRLCIKESFLRHPSIGQSYYYGYIYGIRSEELIFNKAGYCLCYDYNLIRLERKKITKIWVEESLDVTNKELLHFIGENVVIGQRDLPNSIDSYKFCLDMNTAQKLGSNYKFSAQTIIMKKHKYDYLFEEGKNRMRSGFIDEIEVLSENKEWICLGRKNISTVIDLNVLGDLSGIHLIVQYEYQNVDDEIKVGSKEKCEILNEVLEERYKEDIFIPYNKKGRVTD